MRWRAAEARYGGCDSLVWADRRSEKARVVRTRRETPRRSASERPRFLPCRLELVGTAKQRGMLPRAAERLRVGAAGVSQVSSGLVQCPVDACDFAKSALTSVRQTHKQPEMPFWADTCMQSLARLPIGGVEVCSVNPGRLLARLPGSAELY